MAVKRSARDKSHAKQQNSRGKSGQNNFKGKSLLERLALPYDTKKHANARASSEKPGLRVVDGKLLSANDVGVLLRDAAKRTDAKKKPMKPRQGLKTTVRRTERVVRRREPARASVPVPKPYGKDLYLSVSGHSSDARFLRIRNLPLGSNSQVLTTLVENVTGAKVSKSSLVDLPSGSVTAELWLGNANNKLLADVRRQLDGANVDGRVVSVEISST